MQIAHSRVWPDDTWHVLVASIANVEKHSCSTVCTTVERLELF